MSTPLERGCNIGMEEFKGELFGRGYLNENGTCRKCEFFIADHILVGISSTQGMCDMIMLCCLN